MVKARDHLAFKLPQVAQTHTVLLSKGKGNLLLGLGHVRLMSGESLANLRRLLLVNMSVATLRFRDCPEYMVLRQVLLIDILPLGIPPVRTVERIEILARQVEAVIERQVQLWFDLEVV